MSEEDEFLASIRSLHLAESSSKDETYRRDAQRENSTRNGQVEIQYQSSGIGQQRVTTPILFPITFRTEPHMVTGSAVIANPLPGIWHDPVGTAGVYAWKRNSRNLYVGAFIWIRVDAYPLDATATDLDDPAMKTMHYLTFSAQAMKDVPTSSITAALVPRTVKL